MDGLEVAQTIMLQLGDFQFGVDTAAYQELGRRAAYRWASQDLFGRRQALQFTGHGEEGISLPGVIYPEWRGGLGQVDGMRALAEAGEPLQLVDGRGMALGLWVITEVEETQRFFAASGTPRKIEFTLSIIRFDDGGATAAAVEPPSAAQGTAAAIAVSAGAATAVERTTSLARSISGAATRMSGTLEAAAAAVQDAVAPIAATAQDALGALSRSVGVVTELQGLANTALTSVGARPIAENALLNADNMVARSAALLNRAQSASAVIRASAERLEAQGNGTHGAQSAMQAAQAAADNTTALVRQAAAQAATIRDQ